MGNYIFPSLISPPNVSKVFHTSPMNDQHGQYQLHQTPIYSKRVHSSKPVAFKEFLDMAIEKNNK